MKEEMGVTNEVILHLRENHQGSNTQSFDLSDFAFAFGNPLDALMYAKLCWPNFVEFSDMIFHSDVLNSNDDRERAAQMLAQANSRADVEKSFNQFEVPSSFFGKHAGDSSDTEDLYLAELICEMWQARVTTLFPERNVRVICTVAEGEEPSISVFQDETRPSNG
jgi:hypothetical protein